MRRWRLGIIIILIFFMFTACSTGDNVKKNNSKSAEFQDEQTIEKSEELMDSNSSDTVDVVINNHLDKVNQKNLSYFYSPFTGIIVDELNLHRVVMVSIENLPQSQAQSGLEDASIVYEFLVEGGITRLLALYWDKIPNKIGPVRSVRPYIIETALEYNALLLHAGASPMGFNMLNRCDIEHLDQIFKGSYYWRISEKKPPHNLYTGLFKFKEYYYNLTGQEYKQRFVFQEVSFINPDDIKAENIFINYWGNNKISYMYNSDSNNYGRFNSDGKPHLDDKGKQLIAKNVIVQFVSTEIIDEVGRLEMNLRGEGNVLIFKDGILVKGSWKNDGNKWTVFYDNNGEEIKINPGKTWIEVVPDNLNITYY